MTDPYPRWRFFPAFSPPPLWVKPVADVFAKNRAQIDSFVTHEKRMESDDVLRVIADDLESDLGFTVERGKKKLGKLPRPVFFGDEGTYLRTYEIDAFQATEGIALEVEAGRATMGNAIYRDLIQGSLMVDARYLVLAVPQEYRYKSGPRIAKEAELRQDVLGGRGDLQRDPPRHRRRAAGCCSGRLRPLGPRAAAARCVPRRSSPAHRPTPPRQALPASGEPERSEGSPRGRPVLRAVGGSASGR